MKHLILTLTVLTSLGCAQTHADKSPQTQPDVQSLEAKVDKLTGMIDELLADKREASAMRDLSDQCIRKCELIPFIPVTDANQSDLLISDRELCFRDCDQFDANGCER